MPKAAAKSKYGKNPQVLHFWGQIQYDEKKFIVSFAPLKGLRGKYVYFDWYMYNQEQSN